MMPIMKQTQVSDLRDETASRLYSIFLGVIGDTVSDDKTLTDEEIDKLLFKVAPDIARQSIKLADIFVKELAEGKDNG